ncbi:ATP-dependent DNA helicase RecQ [Asanoa ferruginea]|uniref:DNA helicase RecQ n=1 Tax=Asanoa ferruginea TaxID=53367 RepID=A0A3D9ZME7_9ACTN|nr:DNA helicase RecQ [Asanoa ferruginea]REF98387.1 ATP-dependent DNA helicase RecQ [Asanoa ferruginea]
MVGAAPVEVLRRLFGYDTFRNQQAEIIDRLVSGGDALVLMPTGGGKSLCYQIPAIVRPGVGVVISPLIALMQDQVDALRALGVRAGFINSTQEWSERREMEAAFTSGDLDLLYLAPEALGSPNTMRLLERGRIALFAIDEAHCVAQWGHDFRPDYLGLSVLHERWPDVPRIALTATATTATRDEIATRLNLADAQRFVASFDRPNIQYRIVPKKSPATQLLEFLRTEHKGDAGIVYCLSRASVERTAELLVENGIPALPYHAGLDASTRSANQSRFLREDGLVMVATIAFGMGIDKPDVRFVAHLDLPKSVEGYYQETGRAGRDGLPSTAWLAYGLQDVVQQRKMIETSDADRNRRRALAAHLDAMLALCETVSCRRAQMLAYFGEPGGEPQCGNCDTCLTPPSSFDGTVAAQKLLSAVLRLDRERNQRFGAGQVIDILLGRQTDKVTRFRHDQLTVFGIGTELSESEWRGAVRQLLAQGLLAVEGDYGTLLLTDASRAVLGKERQVMLRRDPPKTPRQSRAATPKAAAAAANLSGEAVGTFERLRAWRAATAKEQGVPAYVIFHDATLRQFANDEPRTLAELGKVSGVGENKLAKYGQQVLDVLAESMPTAPVAAPSAAPVAASGAASAAGRAGAPATGGDAASSRASAPAAGRAGAPAASPATAPAAGISRGGSRAAAPAWVDDDLWGGDDLIEPDDFE